MSTLRAQKALVVQEIQTQLQTAQALVVATYQGLSVKQMQALRKLAQARDVKIKIYKNRLVKKALEATE